MSFLVTGASFLTGTYAHIRGAFHCVQVVNEVDGEKLPKFIYSPNYVMGKGVQQEMDPDSMVRYCRCLIAFI